MKAMIIISILVTAIPALVAAKEPSQPRTAETVQILKISAQDERAVINTPDGKTLIIKPGDAVGKRGKVTEIAEGRVVIEEGTGKDVETVIIRLEQGKQTIERLKKMDGKAPELLSRGVMKNGLQ